MIENEIGIHPLQKIDVGDVSNRGIVSQEIKSDTKGVIFVADNVQRSKAWTDSVNNMNA